MKIDFKKEFYKEILNRGYEYYDNGLVRDVKIKNNLITASVDGTYIYEVYVEIKKDQLIDAGCSCPYAEDGSYCKHMAALLYYLTEENVNNDISKFKQKKTELHKIVKKIDKENLESFLVELLIDDDKLYDKFRRKFDKIFPALSLEEYKTKVNNAIKNSAGRDGFIDYRESRDYTRYMNEIIDEIQELADNGNHKLAYEVATFILDTIPETDIDDSNGSTGEVAYGCIEVISTILKDCLYEKNDLAKEILDYIINEFQTSYLSNYGVEIDGLLNNYIRERLYLPEIENSLINILKLRKNEKYFWKRQTYIEYLTDIYDINDDYDKKMNLLMEYCEDNSDIALKLVDEYLKNNDVEKAIQLLKKQLKKSENRIYAEKLADIYNGQNMLEEYKEILYELFFKLNKYDINVFKKIKMLYSKEDWQMERKVILDKVEKEAKSYSYSSIIDIYIEEKLNDKIFDLIKNSHMTVIMRYEEYLLPKYNDVLIDIYIDYCKKFANSASSRDLYRDLAMNLKHIKNMKNSKSRFTMLMDELTTKYKNRPAMQEELKKV